MKLSNPKYPVKASWLRELGHRLDAPPFLSGAIEARKTLERLAAKKQDLVELTRGGLSGIYHVGQDKIQWVEDPAFGMPFLRSSDILRADLSQTSLISRRQVAENPLFQCPPETTLITRSGTIGRTVYVRREMADMAISQDVLKVVPDTDRVLPGYLYAYLSSRFGIPQIVSGTFGSIIVHIEAENIAELKVPRLGDRLEQDVHNLVQEAAAMRSEAAATHCEAIERLHELADLPVLASSTLASLFGITIVRSRSVRSRFDAFFYSPYHREALAALETRHDISTVGEIAASVVEPLRFKRIQVSDREHGVPFFGTSAIMQLDPEPSYLIPRKHPNTAECLVAEGTVLIPRSGQISGIIGQAALPYGGLIGGAVTEDAIRVSCENKADAGFLFIALTSEYGRRQVKARAFGSSIPHLDVCQVRSVKVPGLTPRQRRQLGELGLRSAELRHAAIEKERSATRRIEETIEEMGTR